MEVQISYSIGIITKLLQKNGKAKLKGVFYIKCEIDLSGENFNRINFTEAEILDFYCKMDLPETFEFSVWGATILLDPHWKHDRNFLINHKSEDLYVSGIGLLKINGLLGGSLEVYIYQSINDELNRSVVAKNYDNSEICIKRRWGAIDEFNKGHEYSWDCVMMWPYGFCNLKFYSNSKVAYEFNVEDAISADTFVKNPKLYSFPVGTTLVT